MTKNKQIKPETLNAPNAQDESVNKKAKPVKDKKAKKAKANAQPKRSRMNETFGELKKVSWPTFGKTMAQTGMVIGVVAIFALLVLGVDLFLGWIVGLISG